MKMKDFRELPEEDQRRLLDKLSAPVADAWRRAIASSVPLSELSDREYIATISWFIDDHGGISHFEIDPPDGEVAMRALSIMENMEQELAFFITAIGKTWDDPVLSEAVVGDVLHKARTVLAILEEVDARNYIQPAPPPKRGPTPDEFWENMARRELDPEWTRDQTIAEYRKLPASKHESRKEQDIRTAKMIHAARVRLGIPTKKYKKKHKKTMD